MRIIGGRWRGTRLDVPAAPGLRPTSDRVRETVFNWLLPYLPGACVLDVFAGSGALGLEALSRGASSALLIERDPRLADALRATLARLEGGGRGTVLTGDALALLAEPRGRFDIVFVDPPFSGALWARTWRAISTALAPGALVHVEWPVDADPDVPSSWTLHREGRSREVRHALYRAPEVASPAATLDPDPTAGGPSSRNENP